MEQPANHNVMIVALKTQQLRFLILLYNAALMTAGRQNRKQGPGAYAQCSLGGEGTCASAMRRAAALTGAPLDVRCASWWKELYEPRKAEVAIA